MIAGFEQFPDGYKQLVPRMLASLLYYHRKGNLKDLVSEAHPVFASPAWAMLQAHGHELQFDQAWWMDHNASNAIKASYAAA